MNTSQRIDLSPNCSLTPHGALLFFATLCIAACDLLHSREVVFPRHWAQVKLHVPVSRLHPSRLTIESHGRRCEVGNFLTEEERRGLARRLAHAIGRINESPALA